MDKKMLVFDIDGTLMYKNKISQKVVNTLLEAKKQGNIITIATGRNSRGIIRLAKMLKLNDGMTPIIGLNGAEVFYLFSNGETKHLWQKTFTNNQVTKIVKLMRKYHMNFVAYTTDHSFSFVNNHFNFLTIFMRTRLKSKQVILKKDFSNLNVEILKFVVNGSKKNMKQFRVEIDKLDLSVFMWSYLAKTNLALEINQRGVNKALGLEEAAKIMHVKQEDVIYFGDGSNDKEALRWAGTGVAMGQSRQEIKDCANTSCPSVHEDGTAVWIQENILK